MTSCRSVMHAVMFVCLQDKLTEYPTVIVGSALRHTVSDNRSICCDCRTFDIFGKNIVMIVVPFEDAFTIREIDH